MSLSFRSFQGVEIADVIDAFAALRITVFRDWPYLYDGDLEYERSYLQGYARPGTILIGAFAGDEMVGAATGMPLSHHAEAFSAAFKRADIDMKDTFYCAESVLLSAFRGQGAGHVFFQQREAVAKTAGYAHSTFCAVIRPEDHAARPPGYRPLDGFWRTRGYRPLAGVVARFSWRDIGEVQDTQKPLQFWGKSL